MSGPPAANARLAAIDIATAVLAGRETLTDAGARERGLQERDAAFARHLAYGLLRWLNALEWLSGQLLRRPLRKRDDDIRSLILLGLFELWKDTTAPHAVVHETAGCARLLGKEWAVAVVNGVLRNFLRNQARLDAALAREPERHAHPPWLLHQLQADWPNQWQDIVDANNRAAPLWLRVNRRKTSRSAFGRTLDEAELAWSGLAGVPDAIRLGEARPVQALPGFEQGLCSVQDAAAQLAVEYLSPGPGERILDACAAPGGKACHILERQPTVRLLAIDRRPDRLERVMQNGRRLGLAVETRAADAADTAAWWDGQPFDKILLDAPCSATGVIRRHPEIKWLRTPDQVAAAVAEQERLLAGLWPLLNAGGMLVYATCSVLKCENSAQIHGFLSRHGDAALAGPERQVLPGEDDMDGFYYAVLRKSGGGTAAHGVRA
ncbi:MAG: 16S rRNA (cytosine(967)-C(5))-methyltransferase RsmB [Xanthomonadales bacterium]|nr:16S rRNA (cytosine(967)-C(5))-methyltransferase RsmB [Xanthomonadales bacterium]NIN60136.1 16S rRNA (cytosine(967)-C(5))-methyltransferase RsmB [Xanthomonadales bacterium]NIN74283.1 16S rRNA (cytosine(967)-C(5))-methyltransferase RsmB [Xanthomonadales bacterium]NIO12792.1 16S rRNA (cytosine(967)-C(5))-methyltransferase RsmB [Xanthomonadales bacterium]NIP12529.1 16S rRNA (cytosine(967)-C(5))-methyltransferase RsmB [Xanthomonadales bacterium]